MYPRDSPVTETTSIQGRFSGVVWWNFLDKPVAMMDMKNLPSYRSGDSELIMPVEKKKKISSPHRVPNFKDYFS